LVLALLKDGKINTKYAATLANPSLGTASVVFALRFAERSGCD